jgi:hypothetical protein
LISVTDTHLEKSAIVNRTDKTNEMTYGKVHDEFCTGETDTSVYSVSGDVKTSVSLSINDETCGVSVLIAVWSSIKTSFFNKK